MRIRSILLTGLLIGLCLLLASTACSLPSSLPFGHTPTPDATALYSARATQQFGALGEEVRANLAAYGLPSDEGSLVWVQEDAITLNPGGWDNTYQAFADGLEVSDFVIQVNIIWQDPTQVLCGFMFRTVNNTPGEFATSDHYLFEIVGFPGWTLLFKNDGDFDHMVIGGEDWVISDSVNKNGSATNQIILSAIGDELTVIINGVLQNKFIDTSPHTIRGSFVAVAVGTSICAYENTWIWAYK